MTRFHERASARFGASSACLSAYLIYISWTFCPALRDTAKRVHVNRWQCAAIGSRATSPRGLIRRRFTRRREISSSSSLFFSFLSPCHRCSGPGRKRSRCTRRATTLGSISPRRKQREVAGVRIPVHIWRMGARSRAPREIIEPRKSGGGGQRRRRMGTGAGEGGESRRSRNRSCRESAARTSCVAYKDAKEAFVADVISEKSRGRSVLREITVVTSLVPLLFLFYSF